MAHALKDNTYDEWEKDFRIREYKAYSNIDYWATRLRTKKYSNLDNPTGIYVNKDEEIIVLVGNIPEGQKVSLQCIWEENVYTSGSSTDYYKQTQATGTTYSLEEGVNLLKMQGPGQLFVMYNVDGEQLLNNPAPIKIHIPLGHGVVNGFFDLEEHKTDAKYAELISKATHKYFCVRGERMMFYFHRLKMLDAAPTEILSAIHLWDDIVGWEQSLMGISQYRQDGKINNHMFAISPEGSYMWASDYRMGFVYTYLKNILLRENVMAAEDNAWGPAHEMGHVHQAAINWPSSTESSNNLFSNYVIRRLGKYKSRGRGLTSLANAIYRDKQVWWNMGTSTHQNDRFQWTSTLNGTYLKNRVERLSGGENDFINGSSPAAGMVDYATIIKPGEAIGTFWGYEWTGLDEKGHDTYTDVDGNQMIDGGDRKVIGKANPDFTLGWNNSLSYKNWDLNLFFNGSFGAKRLNLVRYTMASAEGNSRFVTLADAYLKGFDKIGSSATYPSLTEGGNNLQPVSTKWLENADFLRLENISLSYTFPKKTTGFADLRLTFSCQNLFTITGYKGMDPAGTTFSNSSVDVDAGIDMGAYPSPRTFTFGLRMNF